MNAIEKLATRNRNVVDIYLRSPNLRVSTVAEAISCDWEWFSSLTEEEAYNHVTKLFQEV